MAAASQRRGKALGWGWPRRESSGGCEPQGKPDSPEGPSLQDSEEAGPLSQRGEEQTACPAEFTAASPGAQE